MTKTQISETLAGARCFCAITKKQHIAIQTYLLTVIAGTISDVEMLVSWSRCYQCIQDPMDDTVLAYILAQLTGNTGTPSQIIASSPCISCVPPRNYEAFKTYLLATIAGVSTDPNTLVNLAKCFLCRPENILKAIQIYVLAVINGDVVPPIPPTPEPTPESQAQAAVWSAEVVAAGGVAPSVETRRAIGFLFDDLKAAGIFSKFHTLAIFVPDNLTAARTPVIHNLGSSPYTNTNFVEADLNKYGLKGDGTTKHLDTGVGLSDINKNNISMIVMADDSPVVLNGVDIGVWNTSDAYQVCMADGNTAGFYYGCLSDLPGITSTNGRVGTFNVMPAYLCSSRTAVNAAQLYVANKWNTHALVNTNTNAVVHLVDIVTFTVFARKSSIGGTIDSWTGRRLKAVGMSTALTETESLACYNALLACRQRFEDGVTTYGQDWSIRVQKNGGAAPSAATVAALDTFMNTLTSAGLLSKIDVINAIVPDSLIAATTPIWRSWGTDPWTNTGFLAGDLTVNGMVGAANKAFTNTGIVQGKGMRLGQNTGWTMYWHTYVFPPGGIMGASDTEYQFSSGAAGQLLWDTPFSGGGGRLTLGGMVAAYYHCMRSSNSNAQVYSANSGLAHGLRGTNATGGIPAISAANTTIMQVMGRAPFPAGGQIGGRLSFFSFGQALTLAESATYFNAIQALRTALGGGYV